jgi:hypothetical protein
MPLDPMSALSVAASVVQFVDFTSKIICKGKDIYHSVDGVLPENSQNKTVTVRLLEITNELEKPLVDIGSLSDENQSQYHQLQHICKECSSISKELLRHLKDLEVPRGSKHRRWKSFRQALKSVWDKEGIDAMAKRLERLRNELHTQVLVGLRLAFLKVARSYDRASDSIYF